MNTSIIIEVIMRRNKRGSSSREGQNGEVVRRYRREMGSLLLQPNMYDVDLGHRSHLNEVRS